jgi:hypothetical protein
MISFEFISKNTHILFNALFENLCQQKVNSLKRFWILFKPNFIFSIIFFFSVIFSQKITNAKEPSALFFRFENSKN